MEWPRVERVDRFTAWLQLTQPYYESSTKRITEYRVTRAGLGVVAMVGVGLISGFFGLGAGWAVVPTMNLIMGVPLKVAAANSGIIIGMGDSMSVWPYILAGAVIPLFAALWLAGQVVGGLVGAQMLIRVRAGSIRMVMIGVLLFAGFGLMVRGLTTLGYMPVVPDAVFAGVLLLVTAGVALGLTGKLAVPGIRR
ncbi:MAG: sulfite exporter TauE/SafE family protein [Chloroflexi bacterium]|nr:sulfite exporter TauE/SafE family protein [Chloroflexota bacterium]